MSGTTVGFDVQGVLTTAPRQSVDIGITVTGHDATGNLTPTDADVSLRLEGDYGDASLSAGVVRTSSGRATVTLHAPAVPATFSILAHAATGPDARLDVSVSASGFATLRVSPTYAGRRPAPSVTASVFVKSTCADLAAALANGNFKDGTPSIDGATSSAITLPAIPAGSHVAVAVRIKLYASGCVDLDALAADSTRDVIVPLLDRPMALGAIDLASSFTFEPDTTQLAGWSRMLDAAIARAAEAFVAQGTSESAALLDAMRAQVPSASRSQFDTSRAQGTWDSRTTTWLGQHAPTMRERAVGWMAAAKANAIGSLSASLLPAQPGYASLSVASFAGFDTAKIGMSSRAPFTLAADADDVLHVSGTVHLWGSALACTVADVRARAAVAGASDVPTALATVVDCNGLANALVGAGSSYTGCASACTAQLCSQALASMWTSAHDASSGANDDATIDVTASAAATIADDASPASFAGAWVGQVASTGGAFPAFGMKGAASGVQAVAPH